MSRTNVGVNPHYLSDQHLIAEHVEITMVPGSLQQNNYQVRGYVPRNFKLSTGHINFLKYKLKYLNRRLTYIKAEMERRGFQHSCSIDLDKFPDQYCCDWTPNDNDTQIVRKRIVERLHAKPDYHTYYNQQIDSFNDFCHCLLTHLTFCV